MINLEQFIEQDNEYMIVVMSCIYYLAFYYGFAYFYYYFLFYFFRLYAKKAESLLLVVAMQLIYGTLHGRCGCK